MERESGVTRRITEVLCSWDLQGDQMKCESSVTRSIINIIHSSDIERDHITG